MTEAVIDSAARRPIGGGYGSALNSLCRGALQSPFPPSRCAERFATTALNALETSQTVFVSRLPISREELQAVRKKFANRRSDRRYCRRPIESTAAAGGSGHSILSQEIGDEEPC